MVNKFLSWNTFQNQNEQRLIENLWIEANQMYGMDIYYVPKQLNNLDTILGEDALRSFTKYYKIEAYFDTPLGYDGDKMMISKSIGFQLPMNTTFTIAKRRFNEVIANQGAYSTPNPAAQQQEIRPLEGDLIYIPMSKDLWEIKACNPFEVFFQLGQVNVWKLMVEKFAYSSERLTTGESHIDGIETAFSHDIMIPATDSTADNVELNTEESSNVDLTENSPFLS